MNYLPASMLTVMGIFSPLFSNPTFQNFLLLTFGHILCRGRRTITEILRQLGLTNIKNFSKYHEVFSKAKWSALDASKILFLNLVSISKGKIVISIDSTIERRKGEKIKGLGIQRDAVKSTKKRKVLTTGLNWLVSTIHLSLPWCHCEWALPFLTILMPPEKPLSSSKNQKDISNTSKHKTLTNWACQVAFAVRRWVKNLALTIVADSSFATYQLANTCVDLSINLVSRMRLDARFFDFPPIPTGKKGRRRIVGDRIATAAEMFKKKSSKWTTAEVKWYGGKQEKIEYLTGTCLWYGYGIRPVPIRWVLIQGVEKKMEPVCLFCTNLNMDVLEIIEIFVSRWKIEVTFEECRRHLGIETQRQWSDQSISRITPSIFASYSIINLMALEFCRSEREKVPIQSTSWYKKSHVTFSDVLAYVRRKLLEKRYFLSFDKPTDIEKFNLEEWILLMASA
jgi:DDE superfamily endonuclease